MKLRLTTLRTLTLMSTASLLFTLSCASPNRSESVDSNDDEQLVDSELKELEGGNPSAVRIASALHMSGRTLTRRLEDEGTTFKDLLDDLRKSLSLRYVGSTDLGLSEIAFLLGFSQSAAFHRAFKRWTQQTPLEYRRARRG
jgi:AraC-like DNA-binding protein